MGTNEQPYRFEDGDGYEAYMARWSRAACPAFLDWLAATPGASWLDIGCGTGALTQAILATQSPARIEACDPSQAQVETARQRIPSALVRFQVADAQSLPYADATFEVVASALVINFIPDRARAMAEMRRVAREGAVVAGFVWNFADEEAPAGRVRRALASAGAAVPRVPGTADSTLERFTALFASAGLSEVTRTVIDVTQQFESVEALWTAQTTGFAPASAIVKKMSPAEIARAKDILRESLQCDAEGPVTVPARAHAARARKR